MTPAMVAQEKSRMTVSGLPHSLSKIADLRIEAMHPLFSLLRDLDAAKISYQIRRSRSDSLLIVADPMPGLRLEIDVFEDGHIEYCKFTGDETPIEDDKELENIIDHVAALDAKYDTPSNHNV
jgi:hypothetical protein